MSIGGCFVVDILGALFSQVVGAKKNLLQVTSEKAPKKMLLTT